jgi:hypothetical protein
MKINPTRPIRSVRAAKGKTSVSKTGFQPLGEQATSGAQASMETSPIASVDALIALQGEPEVQSATQKATRRAGSLLGILDTIKLGLLEGGIPQPTLKRLLHALGETREETNDPALEAILDQVEVRAQVELAKLEIANIVSQGNT